MSNIIQTIRQSFNQVEVYDFFGLKMTNKRIGTFFALLAAISFLLHAVVGLPEPYQYLQQEVIALNLVFALISVFVFSRPTGFALLSLFFIVIAIAMLYQLWMFGA